MSVRVDDVEEILYDVLEDSEEVDTLEEADIVDVRSRGENVLVEAESSKWIVGRVTEQLLEQGYFIRSRDKRPFDGNLGFFIHETSEVEEEQEYPEGIVIEYRMDGRDEDKWLLDPCTHSPYESVVGALEDLFEHLGNEQTHRFRLKKDGEVLFQVSPEGVPEVTE